MVRTHAPGKGSSLLDYSHARYHPTTSTTRRTAALPAIFKQALYSFRELPFEKSSPGEFISKDEALAEPAWCSHLFTLKNTDYYQTWRVQAEFNRVQDFVHDNKVWTDEQIIDYFTRKFESDYRGHIKVKGRIPIAPGILTKQWRSLVKDCPDYVLNWATGKASTAADHTPSYSEIASKLMRMMGHVDGKGLGPSGRGLTELECWKVTSLPNREKAWALSPRAKLKLNLSLQSSALMTRLSQQVATPAGRASRSLTS